VTRFLCVAQRIGRPECLWAGLAERCEKCGAVAIEVRAAGDVRLWYTRRIAQKPRKVRAAILDWRDQQPDGSMSAGRRAEMLWALSKLPASLWWERWHFGGQGVVMRMFFPLSA